MAGPDLATVVIDSVVTASIPAVLTYATLSWRKWRQGRLTRARKAEQATEAQLLQSTLQRAYIARLREDAISRGVKPVRPPRNLKL